jgi:hypothetical protein
VVVAGRYLNNISPSCANQRREIAPLGLGVTLRVSLKFKAFKKKWFFETHTLANRNPDAVRNELCKRTTRLGTVGTF